MLRKMKNLLLFVTLVSLIVSCTSPKEVLEMGDYDRAISMAINKIAGKKRKKDKYVKVLESAFNKANAEDLHRIEVLKMEGNDQNWELIHRLYGEIGYRQSVVKPLLPLIGKKGYKPKLNFVDADKEIIESRKKSAVFLYNNAIKLLNEYEEFGDKHRAREAYDDLMKLDKLYNDYKDKDELMDKASKYGTDTYAFAIINKSQALIPKEFENEIKSMGAEDLQSNWKNVDLNPVNSKDYDYDAIFKVTNVIASPESQKERQFDESKEIEDGFDYVLDSNGNVMKDSLGNDIKLPRKVFIKGTVLEVHQYKDIRVSGYLEIFNKKTSALVTSFPINAVFIFENYASKFLYGDKRALSDETKRYLGNSPRPFPSDIDMLLDAANEMKWDIKKALRSFNP